MAALSFPGSPLNGATYTVGVQTWQWDATNLAWRLIAVPQVGVGAITTTNILDGTILDVDINSAAGIALTKLASGTSAYHIVCNGSGQPAYVQMTGDITQTNTGVTAIGTGVIVDADISGSAAIALSKLATSTPGNIVVYSASNIPTSTAMSGDVFISNSGATTIQANKVLRTMIQPYGVDLSGGTTGSIANTVTGDFTGFTSTSVGTGTNAITNGFQAAVTGMWAYTIRITGGSAGLGLIPIVNYLPSGATVATQIFSLPQGGNPTMAATGTVWLASGDRLTFQATNNTSAAATLSAAGNIRLITNS